jgi:hypothetical protein
MLNVFGSIDEKQLMMFEHATYYLFENGRIQQPQFLAGKAGSFHC